VTWLGKEKGEGVEGGREEREERERGVRGIGSCSVKLRGIDAPESCTCTEQLRKLGRLVCRAMCTPDTSTACSKKTVLTERTYVGQPAGKVENR